MREKPLICLVGWSGCGKTMLQDASGLKQVTSYTTRQIRDGEEDGVDYHFKSLLWMHNNKFLFTLDWKDCYGQIYGATDQELNEKEIFVVLFESAIELRAAGLNVHIILVSREDREIRPGREEPEYTDQMMCHVDDTIHNDGTEFQAYESLVHIQQKIEVQYLHEIDRKMLREQLEEHTNHAEVMRREISLLKGQNKQLTADFYKLSK